MRDTKRNFLRLLDETWPGLAKAFVAAMQKVRNQVALQALERAIARGDVQAAFDALRLDAAALYGLDEAIENAFRQGGRYQIESVVAATLRLPKGRQVTAAFGGRNPRAERIARELGSRLVTEVVDDTRAMIAETIRGGLEAGRNPRGVALEIAGRMEGASRKGGLVGLHSSQARYVTNMRADLETLDARYFTREKRDRRFDAAVRRAIRDGKPLSRADIDKITGRYADRLLSLRGENIGRTEALRALNAGRQEGLDQLIERGDVTADQVTRVWDDTGDGRTRETHRAADGQEQAHGQPFMVGGYMMQFPGDTSYGAPASEVINCRCYLRPKIDFFKGLE